MTASQKYQNAFKHVKASCSFIKLKVLHQATVQCTPLNSWYKSKYKNVCMRELKFCLLGLLCQDHVILPFFLQTHSHQTNSTLYSFPLLPVFCFFFFLILAFFFFFLLIHQFLSILLLALFFFFFGSGFFIIGLCSFYPPLSFHL